MLENESNFKNRVTSLIEENFSSDCEVEVLINISKKKKDKFQKEKNNGVSVTVKYVKK
jgi:hypothetical protein